jgi:signal transduction histidine kinase
MRRLAPWLVLLLPWAVPAMVLLLQRPPAGEAVLDLRGDWVAAEVLSETPPTEPGAWRRMRLPGYFNQQGFQADSLWLRREVTVSEAAGSAHTFVLGGTRSAVMQLFFNGVDVGESGVLETGDKAELNGLDAIRVAGSLVRPGVNSLLLKVRAGLPGYSGIGDRRLLFGPTREVMPWFLRTQRIEAFLRAGPVMVLAFLAMLQLVLARLATDGRERRLALLSVALAAAVSLYLVIQAGLGVTGLVPHVWRYTLVLPAVFCAMVCFVEFAVEMLVGHRTALARVNGWASVVVIVVYLGARLFALDLFLFWRIAALWPMAMIFYVAALVGKDQRGHFTPSNALFASTLLALIVTATGDMLSDMGLVHWPRMFAMSLVNVPLLTGVVVVARFLGLAEHNRALTLSLSRSNEELVGALVEAREATRLKSEFLATVSHELRTPLNAIINIPEGLLEDFTHEGGGRRYHGDPNETSKHLESLHRSGVHLLGVVNQVLDFSQLEVGRMTLRPERVEIEPMLDETRRALQALAKKRGVKLLVSGAVGEHLMADREKVSQVLLNLGDNAVKFSPEHATVEFHVSVEGDAVEFAVKDQGIGIASAHQALIFESFRQVEGHSTRQFGGMGLGLAIARKLTEMHGGSLSVLSAPGQGSTFVARFPQAGASATNAA